MAVNIEEEIRKVFMEDKDVESVSFQQVSRDYAERDALMNVISFAGVPVYISHIFYRGHVLVDYCVK